MGFPWGEAFGGVVFSAAGMDPFQFPYSIHYIHKSARPAMSATSDCRTGDGLWTKAIKYQGKGTAGKWTGDRCLENGFPIKHDKPLLTNICRLLPCLSYFGKKARNNPVPWYKNVRSFGRAAVIVPLVGYLILQERWVKGRAGTAPVWHLEETLSHRVSICMSPVNPSIHGAQGLVCMLWMRALLPEPLNLTTCLQCGHLCVTRGKAAQVTAAQMLVSDGATANRACCHLKNPSEIQWALVQLTVDYSAPGLPHPQPPTHCNIHISEVIISSFSFFIEDSKWLYFSSIGFFPSHSHYSRLTETTLLKLNLSSSSSHHWFLVWVFLSNQKPHCTPRQQRYNVPQHCLSGMPASFSFKGKVFHI